MYINEGGDGSEKGGTRRDAFWGFGFVQCIRFSLECIIAQTAAATAVAAAASLPFPPPPLPPERIGRRRRRRVDKKRPRTRVCEISF